MAVEMVAAQSKYYASGECARTRFIRNAVALLNCAPKQKPRKGQRAYIKKKRRKLSRVMTMTTMMIIIIIIKLSDVIFYSNYILYTSRMCKI